MVLQGEYRSTDRQEDSMIQVAFWIAGIAFALAVAGGFH
jgi:hypothetical protein